MNGILAFWLIEVGLIAYKDVKEDRTIHHLPPPSDFLATFVVFGTLAAVGSGSPQSKKFATVFAGGIVLATLFGVLDPANPLGSQLTGSFAKLGIPGTGTAGTNPGEPKCPPGYQLINGSCYKNAG
jgi:hypothetical protein